jgi:hypothetical protein
MSALTVEEKLLRIARTKQYWLKYRIGEETLQVLEDRLAEPMTHRMRNILIISETNNGKTTIAEKFLRRHRPEVNLSSASVVPILKIEATAADENRFYNAILEKLPVYKHGQSARGEMKQLFAIRALSECGIRMLIIDELHNMLDAPPVKQRRFMRVLKTLGNELRIPIVALGTREALNALNSDPQLANRFQTIVLPRWKLENDLDPNQPSEYRQFLVAFERLLPLDEASDLGNDPLASKIFAMSEGTIGEATDLVRDAARWAVRHSRRRIDAEVLDRCGYVPPSRRPYAGAQL